ncbi:MAG TPA: hypothetical protein VFD83_05830, partial [Candidatus Polarisedimenticolia bacterium]|nr:hypothetical protein [Candidatus Polarisedimenticolia bacterium]
QRERGGVIVRDRVVRNRVYSRPRVRGSIGYSSPRFRVGGTFGGYSTWHGAPVRRDVLVIRDNRYGGGYFRARRVYCAPRYYGHLVYVRPVRFFIAADACIGPISLRARIVRPHYLYGCNFCDARFDSYGGYCQHVEHCGARPSGFEISVSNWDEGQGDDWDGPYQTDDSYHDDHGGYDDQYYDDSGDQDDDGGYYDDER